MRKEGLNRIVAELVDTSSSGRITLRKWVFEEGKDRVDAHSINAIKWTYKSTMCPSIWAKKKYQPSCVAVERAEDLFDRGYRFFRVCAVPKRPTPRGISLEEQEARARAFFDEEAHARARINADLREIGLSLVLVAQQCAIKKGEEGEDDILDPHAHYLLAVCPDADWCWSEQDARQQVADRVTCHHQFPAQHSPRAAEVTNAARGYLNREGLIEHVRYGYGYPIRAYAPDTDGGSKLPLRDAVEHPLFLRAVAALAAADYSFKGSVVVCGKMRKPSTKIEKQGPIHVAPVEAQLDLTESLFPAGEPLAAVINEPEVGKEGEDEAEIEQTDFLFGLFPEQADFTAQLFPGGEPRSARTIFAEFGILLAADAPRAVRRPAPPAAAVLVQIDFTEALFPPRKWLSERVAACCATPPATEAHSREIAQLEPKLLHVFMEPGRHITGIDETIAITEGCRGWSRAQIEDHFPFLGVAWARERQALRMSEAGLSDEDVIDLLDELSA